MSSADRGGVCGTMSSIVVFTSDLNVYGDPFVAFVQGWCFVAKTGLFWLASSALMVLPPHCLGIIFVAFCCTRAFTVIHFGLMDGKILVVFLALMWKRSIYCYIYCYLTQ